MVVNMIRCDAVPPILLLLPLPPMRLLGLRLLLCEVILLDELPARSSPKEDHLLVMMVFSPVKPRVKWFSTWLHQLLLQSPILVCALFIGVGGREIG